MWMTSRLMNWLSDNVIYNSMKVEIIYNSNESRITMKIKTRRVKKK